VFMYSHVTVTLVSMRISLDWPTSQLLILSRAPAGMHYSPMNRRRCTVSTDMSPYYYTGHTSSKM
jgi:hypothetical protein